MESRVEEHERESKRDGFDAMNEKKRGNKAANLPPHLKYPRYMSASEERKAYQYKPTPSMLTQDLASASVGGNNGGRKNRYPVPEIIEFIKDPNAEGTTVPLDEPLFQPYPLHMQFKDYAEYGVYRQTLYFRNNDSVPRRLRVEALDGPNFSVRPNPRANDRVAPGMELSFEVTFKPQGKRDYREKIVCVTEREKFLVEISALGPWACMDFPDEVGFGTCPVNHLNERTFLVRNIGERDTRFALRATEPFDVEPRAGFLAMKETIQVTLKFNADHCAEFDGELEVAYENGQTSYVHVHGSTESINVSIDKPVAEVDPAYITLMSTCTVRITNDADIPVNFEWKSFATSMEEDAEKARLLQELDRLEDMERDTIEPILLKQKYKHLRRAVEDDAMLFSDENFKIEPISGQVWSHSSKEVTITFSPHIAADYASVSCLAVTGRENRIPLKILGQGIGPKAAFNVAIVDVGSVFIGSHHSYEIELDNRGDIKCEYSLDYPTSDLGKAVIFTPSRGTLGVEDTQTIKIDFCSQKLGAFSEIVTFSMNGSKDKLRIRLKGSVIGPTFDLNVSEFNFGRIAYGFENTRDFIISNTSAIPMEFALRVPGDGKFDEPEFIIEPSTGVIPASEEQPVQVRFTSRTVVRYQMDLVVDVIGIGLAQCTVPIQAECAVPSVGIHAGIVPDQVNDGFQAIAPEFDDYGGSDSAREGDVHLDFGPCFLRYPYSRQLLLRNTSDVRAYFEILPQEEATYPLASYEPNEVSGTIEPMSEYSVDVTIRVEKAGKLSLPLLVRIRGSDKPPLMVDMTAHGCGPNVCIEPSNELDFGTVACLSTAKLKFTMHNRSLIPAPYASFLKDTRSKFTVDCTEGCLGPGEDLECTVTVCPDDTTTHRDELHLVVTEGESIIVNLKAKGSGTTIHCQELTELQKCTFGNVFTSRVHERKFLLENRGRREQLLTWTNLTLEQSQNERKKKIMEQDRLLRDKDPEVQKKAAKIRVPGEPQPTFTVYPDTVMLKPRMGCMFTIRGESNIGGELIEKLVLESKVGKDKKASKIIDASIGANFVNPLLHASLDVIEFCFTFDPDEKSTRMSDLTQRRPLKLRNVSQLPLNFILRTQEPFSVDTWEINLEPDEETSVNVLFNPLLKSDDLKTQTLHGKLIATHQNHPQKDSWDIRAQINFPNLDFEYNELNFGCLLNDTSTTQKFRITNCSVIDTMYSWAFLEEDWNKSSRKLGFQNGVVRPEPNDVFDIRPIRGLLRPGESQEVEVSYYAHANQKFNVTAICEVEGGPEYELLLKGEASHIHFKLDQDGLDFGDLIHDTTEEQAFTITNTSKVAFDFRIVSPYPDIVSCSPTEGRIFAKDTQKVAVKFSPKIPEIVVQNLMIEIAHLEPLAFPVRGRGIFASAILSLPRLEDISLRTGQEIDDDTVSTTVQPKSFAFGSQLTEGEETLPPEVQEWLGLLAEAEEALRVNTAGSGNLSQSNVGASGENDAPMADTSGTKMRPVSVSPSAPSPARSVSLGGTERPPATAPARSSNQPLTPSTTASSDHQSGSQSTGASNGTKRTKSTKSSRSSKRSVRFDMTKVRVETEASRLKFARFLHNIYDRQGLDNVALPQFDGDNVFTLATYIVDFGNVVVGKSKKKVFRVLNTSMMPLSFAVPSTALAGSSFSIEPAQVNKLAENESVELQIQFAAKKDAALGPLEWAIPLDIVNGPPVQIKVRANVTMPEVSISPSEVLDFGDLMVGQCKVVSFQLKNISPVAAEWSIQPEKTTNRSADSRAITCTPTSGTLQPNHRCNIEVTFTPREARAYTSKLPLKIVSNPRTRAITCKGSAKSIELEVTSDVLQMRPTLPSQGDSAIRQFQICNRSECPVEVYSIDFDEQYLKEESILTAVLDSMGYAMNMKAQPRKAGEPLQQSVVEQYAELQQDNEAAAATAQELDDDVEAKTEDGEHKNSEIAKEDGVGELEDVAETLNAAQGLKSHPSGPSYRERGLAMDMLLLAPKDLPWRAELTDFLCEKAGGQVPSVELDTLIERACEAGDLPVEVCVHYGLSHPDIVGGAKPPKKTRPMKEDELVALLRKSIQDSQYSQGILLTQILSKYSLEGSPEDQTLLHVRAVRTAFTNVSPSQSEVEKEPTGAGEEEPPSTGEANGDHLYTPQNPLHVLLFDWTQEAYQLYISSLASESEDTHEVDEDYFAAKEEFKTMLIKKENQLIHDLDVLQDGKIGDEENDADDPAQSSREENPGDEEKVPGWLSSLTLGEDFTSFEQSSYKIQTWLPHPGTPRPADWDEQWIPIPKERILEILDRPTKRTASSALSSPFRIEAILSNPSLDENENSEDNMNPGGDSEEAEPSDGHEVLEVASGKFPVGKPVQPVEGAPFRWVIPPSSTLTLQVIFNSRSQGSFEQQLSFQAVGSHRQYWVLTQGVCTVPSISSDPRNVFMNRIKARPEHRLVSKKYVMAKSLYEFGPLLVGKDSEACMGDENIVSQIRNYETFRISNSSILPVNNLRLMLISGYNFGPDSLDQKVFRVEPSEMSLEAGETKDVRVWAFPTEEILYHAKLVCCVQDNPEVCEFALSCLGARPHLEINGPWDQEDTVDDSSEKKTEVPEKVLDFGRLLLKRQEERTFSVSNTSTIPVAWKLDLEAFADIPSFTVFPSEGKLAPGETRSVIVQFLAEEPSVHELSLQVIYTDTEAGEFKHAEKINVQAEAYTIQVQPDFRQEGDDRDQSESAGIDFGMRRVFETVQRQLTIKNTGKYPVEFDFRIRKKLVTGLVKIQPSHGALEADEEAQISLEFCSKNEVQLRNNKDIQCLIREPATGETVESFDVPVDACSVFSKFRVQPSKGIHFGAVKFEGKPEKTFEIRNDGLFPFSYEVLTQSALSERVEEREARMEAALKELESKATSDESSTEQENDVPGHTQSSASLPTAHQLAAARAKVELAELQVLAAPREITGDQTLKEGLFEITPSAGIIEPGSVVEIQVRFNAEGDTLAHEALRILISGRSPSDGSLLPPEIFEIAGESHVPGINTSNYDSIFEEQGVVRSLDPKMQERGVFSTEEKIFTFGAVIHTSVTAQGICERFKISNPNKIKAQVNFEIIPRNSASENIFSVHPSNIELPSHEHEFVSVYFKPTAINKYAAKFRATVVDGERKAETHVLEFDLQGEGTLPCLTVVEPSHLSNDAKYIIDLGRTRLRKPKTQEITVRNDGIVPATVRFDMDVHKSISCPMRNSSLVLQPQESRSTSITFEPLEEGEVKAELLVRVLHNEFELSRFVISGEGYQEAITFEDLPGQADDVLTFGDIALQVQEASSKLPDDGEEEQVGDASNSGVLMTANKTIRFALKNNVDSVLRYSWNNQEVSLISFSPSIGHIPPFGSTHIEASLSACEPISLNDVAAKLHIEHIQYQEEAFAQAKGKTIRWNNTMKVSHTSIEDAEGERSDTVPEPAHEPVAEKENKDVFLKCNAEVDTVRYKLTEGQEHNIHFRPTMMFQSRVFKLPVRNDGRMAMDVSWSMRSSNNSIKATLCPFSIVPAQAHVPAGSEQIFVVRYAPLEVEDFDFVAEANIPFLNHEQQPLHLRLTGIASRPVCHFELESSTYLERRKSPLPGLKADATVKVIELQSLGTRIKNTKRFHVVNPTSMAYEFELIALGESNPVFKCATSKGMILPGKRCELSFSFSPTNVDLQESLWEFRIPEQQVSQMLLLVGTVSEPRVELNRKHVNFNSILVGGYSEETVMIINHEDIPFSFSFDSASFRDLENDIMQLGGAEDLAPGNRRARSNLRIEPMSGTVGPNSTIPLTVRFAPGDEKRYNFNLVCNVQRKPDKLSLNVKGEGSAIHDRLIMDLSDTSSETHHAESAVGTGIESTEVELCHGEKNSNELNFGLIHVNDRATRTVSIHNRGKFNFDFLWVPPVELNDLDESLLTLSPLKGTVNAGETIKCTFVFHPAHEVAFDNLRFQCTVAGARKYFVVVSGRGSKPLISFSSMKLNFGPCFVADPGARSPRVEEEILVISNNETENPIAVDCTWVKTDFLDVVCEPSVLQPGERMEAIVRFSPHQLKSYPANIPFEINGLYTVNVLFNGEGTPLRVELENPDDQTLHFGGLRQGQSATKTFTLVNRSRRAVKMNLESPDDRLEQTSLLLSPAPGSVITLRPRESCTVTVSFEPEKRLSAFSVPVFLHVNGSQRKLLTITGSCLAVDVKLELSNLSFGAVCESCRLTRKIQVENAGDLGARFRWELTSTARDNFSIFPMEGVLPPHAQLMVDATFHPGNVGEEIRGDARLFVEGNEQGMFPLNLSGSCIAQPEDGISNLEFSTKVRVPQKQSIVLKNPTKTSWILRPTIHNNSWSGSEHVDVPAGGSSSYELTFRPLSMTSDESGPHEGSVFFALPTGQSLLFKMHGTASAPDAEDNVKVQTAAKQTVSVPLKVDNWCRTGQRMTVGIEKVSGPPNHFFRGAGSLDVPGGAHRDYKLVVLGHTVGESVAKVTFTNQRTGEFLFYLVSLTVGAPKIQSTLTMETSVRQTTWARISIENPFFGSDIRASFEPAAEKELYNQAKPTTTWWSCTSPAVRVKPSQTFADCSEGVFEIEYRPLVATTLGASSSAGGVAEDEFQEHDLVLRSNELGEYPYKLRLRATPAQTERSLQFRTTLGNTHEQVFRFTNYASAPTEYSCQVGQHMFFQVDAKISVQPATSWRGSEVAVKVQFEPQGLGSVRDVLRVTSTDGGEYTCALYGTCDPPRPRGPFVLDDASQAASIEFKNVFDTPMEFKFITDSEAFSVNGARTQLIKIDAHKSITLTVKATSTNVAATGKLLATCAAQPDLPAWSFYLRAGSPVTSGRQ